MNTKQSSTRLFLESHEVFTADEFEAFVDPQVSRRTRESNLRNAVKRDQAYRLTRALYASNVGPYRERVPNVLLVAAKAAPDSVLAYHTALEAHGVAHSPGRAAYFVSSRTVSPFDVHGYRVRQAPDLRGRLARRIEGSTSGDGSLFVTQLRSGDALVPATSRERTLVDCLYRLDLAGGIEEFLRSAGSFSTASSREVSDYVCPLRSPTLVARVGWLLALMQNDWLVEPAPLDEMRRRLGRGTYWLQPRRAGVRYEFVAEWRLYVPADLPYLDWLHG